MGSGSEQILTDLIADRFVAAGGLPILSLCDGNVSPVAIEDWNRQSHPRAGFKAFDASTVGIENAISERGDQNKHVSFKGEVTLTANTEDGKGEIYYTEDGSDPTSSPQRKTLAPGEGLTITGNKKIRMVVSDEEGNYSAIRTIDAIDELVKYKIIRPAQSSAFDETITFVFPKEKEDAKITINSLLQELIKSGIFTERELAEILPKLINQTSYKTP